MTVKKICILGSSYIGAVYRAYRANPPREDSYAFDFYGHSNGGFPNVDIDRGNIVNIRFRSHRGQANILGYDAFFLYADLPSPFDLTKLRKLSYSPRYSQQLSRAILTDMLNSKNSMRLRQKIRDMTGKPVFVIPSNIMYEAHISEVDYKVNSGILTKIVGEDTYVDFPSELFDEEFRPKPEYYKDSVRLTGELADQDRFKGHDYHHMNETGGQLMLRRMIEVLDRLS